MNIPIMLESNSPIKLQQVKKIFEKSNIETRPIIAGNILKHPALKKSIIVVIKDLMLRIIV
jgi:hypothetical protein